MPDVRIEKESPFKKLSKDDRDKLATTIAGWWSDFHKKRIPQLDTAKELKQYVFLNQSPRFDSSDKDNNWRTDLKENKIATTWESKKAGMWKEIWNNPEQMFDVVGVTEEDEEIAEHQKEALTHALKKMDAGIQFDMATDNWGIYGDFIYKTDWKSRRKKVKRYDATNGLVEVELPIKESANIEAINPIFFNFDTSKYKYGDEESWNKCPKIFKRFATVEEIQANPSYTLTKEQIEELNENIDTKVVDRMSDAELAEADKYGDQYEVLYLHGDIKFNGVSYHNIVAEVLAGKYLIYFEENPIYICPFVYDVTQLDPLTGRGISPLKSILEMCKVKEMLLNQAGDIAQLQANPPVWANDTFLKDKYKNGLVPYRPGKVLEYENNYNGQFPTPVNFNANGIEQMIGVLANSVSDASGINANAMGNVEQGKRLATDLQLAQRGSDSRIAMQLDKIYQINLAVIKNVAELEAMFHIEPEMLLVKEKGLRVQVEINNAIRQGNYNYIYEDRNALMDRHAKVQEALAMLNNAASNPDLYAKIDWVETLKTGLETIGFDNPEKFFKDDDPIEEVANIVRQLPEELQSAIGQQIQPIIQQAVMIAQQGGMNGDTQGQA